VGVADVVTCSTHKTIRAGRGGMVMCGADLADPVDTAVMPGTQGGPLMHDIAGKAAGFAEALADEFDDYAAQVVANADALAERLRERGFDLVSGGTDVHFALVDFRENHPELTGRTAETVLEDAGLVANKQTVPGDSRKATVASGLRIGTPAITTRGFDESATRRMADALADVLDAPASTPVRDSARETVRDLCREFPVYDDSAPVVPSSSPADSPVRN